MGVGGKRRPFEYGGSRGRDNNSSICVADTNSTEMTAHDFLTHDISLLSFGHFQFIEDVKNTSGSVSPCVQRWAGVRPCGSHDDITPNGTVKPPWFRRAGGQAERERHASVETKLPNPASL